MPTIENLAAALVTALSAIEAAFGPGSDEAAAKTKLADLAEQTRAAKARLAELEKLRADVDQRRAEMERQGIELEQRLREGCAEIARLKSSFAFAVDRAVTMKMAALGIPWPPHTTKEI